MKKVRFLGCLLSLLTVSAFAMGQERPSPQFTDWSAPVNVGPPISLPGYADQAAVLSRDEKSLFFTSNRAGTFGGEDIWVARRKNKNAPWMTPVNLGSTINTPSIERVRTLSDDGKVLLFQSDRTSGGLGGFDIWAIVRKNPNDDFGWRAPINLGSTINTSANEIAGKSVFAGIPKMYFSSARTDVGGLGLADIYESEILSDGTFGIPVNRFELNSPSIESCFWVRDDGLEILFSTTRPSLSEDPAGFDLWMATRMSVYAPWSAPVSLGPTINTAGVIDVNPALSADATTLLFSSRRSGDMDIYMSTRQMVRVKN